MERTKLGKGILLWFQDNYEVGSIQPTEYYKPTLVQRWAKVDAPGFVNAAGKMGQK